MGKSMIDYASQGDLASFQELLRDADDQELMYWHVTKGLKAAVKNKQVGIVRYLIDDLRVSLDHEAFRKYLHLFLFGCQEAEDEAAWAVQRELLALLVRGKGSAVDEPDDINQSTPLMVACEHLSDLDAVRILVDGGSDVNSVNADDKMPLGIVKERIEKAPETAGQLKVIYEYLEGKGAKVTWRDKRR
jgi:ankyrin repeat protein